MTPDQVIKPIVLLFVVFVMVLAIRSGGKPRTR
jgi:hypothetical protein